MPAQGSVGVLLALRGAPEEELVRRIATEPGLTVVRRCADVAELTAAAVAGLGTVALLDADLGVDRTIVDRLQGQGTRTIVCCEAEEVRRYDGLGALALARGVDPIPAIRSLADAAGERGVRATNGRADGDGSTEPGGAGAAPDLDVGVDRLTAEHDPDRGTSGRQGEDGARDADTVSAENSRAADVEPATESPATCSQRRRREREDDAAGTPPARRSRAARDTRAPNLLPGAPESHPEPRVVAVTGPAGAPGRSTIAINLAQELAEHGEQVVLIDADLWGGAIAQMLGLLAETAGLSAAIRAADHGRLDDATFARLAPRVADRLRVLPGLARATRWREVSAVGVLALLEVARRAGSWVVVETPVLVPEEEAGYSLGPGRNDVARSLLGVAEEIVVVGAGEPVGIERLVQNLLDLDDVTTTGRRRVLVNRVRSSAAGARAGDSVREALARFADVPDPVLVPDDRALCDRALLAGTTWREAGGRSLTRAALTDLAGVLRTSAGRPAPAAQRRRARFWPWTWRRAAAH